MAPGGRRSLVVIGGAGAARTVRLQWAGVPGQDYTPVFSMFHKRFMTVSVWWMCQ